MKRQIVGFVLILGLCLIASAQESKRPQPKPLDAMFCSEESLNVRLMEKHIRELNAYIDQLEKENAKLKEPVK